MLAKKYKLSSSSFPRPSHLGRSGRYLSVNLSPTSLPFSRFGIIVSLKYDKRAVARHRLKREIFELIRKTGAFRVPGHDIVVVVKKGVTSVDLIPITKEASSLLSNL